jgi:hypothetical protein
VIAGQLIVRYADHEEVIAVGEAYYLPPGHVRSTPRTPRCSRSARLRS